MPGVAFIGEAGMGKSRLATAAADLAEESGNPVLALIGSPFHTDAGLLPDSRPARAAVRHRRATEHDDAVDPAGGRGAGERTGSGSAIPLLAPVLGIAFEHRYQPVRAEGRKLYERILRPSLAICSPAVGAAGPRWCWPRICSGLIRQRSTVSSHCWARTPEVDSGAHRIARNSAVPRQLAASSFRTPTVDRAEDRRTDHCARIRG